MTSADSSAATELSARIAASAATVAAIPDTNPRACVLPTEADSLSSLDESSSPLSVQPAAPSRFKFSRLKAAKAGNPTLRALFEVLDCYKRPPSFTAPEGCVANFILAAWRELGCACGYDEQSIYYFDPPGNWRVLSPMAFMKQWMTCVESIIAFYLSLENGGDDEGTVSGLFTLRNAIRGTTSRRQIQAALLLAVHEDGYGLRFRPTPLIRDSAGTAICLFAGETHPSTCLDYILHPFGAAWNSEADASEWEAFFRNFAWCPRAEGESAEAVALRREQRFLHILETLARYISGDYSDKSFTIVHGEGDNGKGILCKGLEMLLGKTFKVASKGVFQATRASSAGAATTQYNSFIDKRLAVHNETKSSACFNWEFIKTLTGNDKLPARALYHDEQDIKVQTHILLLVNKVMNTRGADEASQRRLRLFQVHFRYVLGARRAEYPEGQAWADPQVEARLLAPAAMSGLLRLLVEASVRFARRGEWLMGAGNEEAIEIGREYIEFFEARYFLVGLGVQPNGRFADIPRTEVYRAYVDWCREMNLQNDDPEMFYRNVNDTWSGMLLLTKTTMTVNKARTFPRVIRGLAPKPQDYVNSGR